MATDQEIRDAGFKYISQQKYLQNPFKIPVAPVGAPEGNQPFRPIPNSFNSGGGGGGDGFTGIPNSSGGPGPNTPITGGFNGAGYGVDPITGDIMGGGNIVDEFGTKGDVYAGTGITPGVNTVTGDLPSGGNIVDEFQEDGKDYSQSSFEETEEEEKKGFVANMISRANQIGSSIPGWAKTAAKSYGLGTLLASPYAMVLPAVSGIFKGKNYQQYDPRGVIKGGIYSIDGVNYTNSSMVNDSYDPVTDTNRFDRAKPGSFGSFRTLADYFNSKKDDGGKETTGGNETTGGTTDTAENTQGGGYSCFIAGTKVTMSDGTLKNIEDIKVGDKIKGHKNNNTVIKLDPTLLATRKLYSFNNNDHYFFTSEHPFMTEEGWKSVKPEKTKERDGIELYNQLEGELKIGDKLVTDKGLIEITDIKSKEINKPNMPLYNFNVSNDNSYIADGYVVHNKGGSGSSSDNSDDQDGGASADAQSDDAAGAGGYARGGRAGYFFGGRVNYKIGGRVSFKNGGLASIL